MEQTQGFVVHSPGGDHLVCHLRKALYGIREDPRAWNALLTSWLISCGFKQSLVDLGVFTIYYESLLYILTEYVDDSILVGRAGKFTYRFKLDLSNRFKIEDLGPASWLLGCNIEHDRVQKILQLGQSQYVSEILEDYSMATCSTVGTPMVGTTSSSPNSSDPLNTKLFPFPQMIGNLLYCSNCTRPDITVAVNHLSRPMSHPTGSRRSASFAT
jgi:hypothetical protein